MKRLKESKTLSSKAFAKIKGTKLEATKTRGVRAGTARGQYAKKEKSSYEKIYDGLFDLEYTPYATKNGGLEISRKYSKNLDKARELLNKLGVKFKERESQGRIYIEIDLPKQEKERVLESSRIDNSKYNEVFVKYSDSTMGESYTLKREDDIETLFRIIKKDISNRIEDGKSKFSLEIDFDLSLLNESKLKEETSGYDSRKAREYYKGYAIFPTQGGFKAIDYNEKEKFREETLDGIYKAIDRHIMSSHRREARKRMVGDSNAKNN